MMTILSGVDLITTDLTRANLSKADLDGAHFVGANLFCTNFTSAQLSQTIFIDVDLCHIENLVTVKHGGPSSIGTDTLELSKGRIPEIFLQGCGFKPWQILEAKLYDPHLTASEINDLQYKIFEARTSGPLLLGGVFISYSHADAEFVDKVRSTLLEKGVSVWLDKHDTVAGPLQNQIDRAIGLNNAVLLVLSKDSIASDWVEHEMKTARRIERKEKRDILCPVTLDDAWKQIRHDVNWEHLTNKNILDFSKWETDAFNDQFDKLLKGLKISYTGNGDVNRKASS